MCKGDGQGTVNAPELNEFGQFWRPKSRMHGGCVVNVPRIQRGQFAHIQVSMVPWACVCIKVGHHGGVLRQY